tara:strand:- start:516 stop:1016 length:501 start_codon:yes stop_codon:yes gene_type:complete
MIDPFNNMRRYLVWSFILIIFLIISGIAIADNHDLDLDKKSFAEVQQIEWHNADGTIQRSIKVEDGSQKVLYDNVKVMENDADQYCYIKVIIKESANGDISKEEKLYCSDGRHGNNDTPNYWELFAKFYYNNVDTPEYCRFYSRKKHAFKSFGKVCMNKDGEWRVK